MKNENRKMITAKSIIGLFFLVVIIMPLITMLTHLKDVNIVAVISSPQFSDALKHSVIVSLTATVLSVALAYLLAWCIARTNLCLKGSFSVLFTLPMLIPSISHGMGLIILLGENGILTNLFHLNFSIYGFWGIVIGSILYSFPVAFLMILDVLRYEDYVPYEAASVLGISRVRQFLSITVPYIRKPMISVVFATFTLVVTDYGVPLMIGGQYSTLPVMMYQDVIGLLDFGKGSLIGLFLLVPALLAFLFDFFNQDHSSQGFVTQAFEITKNKLRDGIACGVSILTTICIFLPIAAFGILTFVKKYPINMQFTFDNILKSLDMKAGTYFMNSLIIAISVSIIGVGIAYLTAYLTARSKGKSARLLHVISITSLAIPGLVLGLSYVLFFKGTILHGTIAILVLVNSIHFFASPYLLAYNSFGKLNENLEDVGTTLGISRARMLKDVFVPQMRDTLLEMFSYFFVNAMMTISAVSFLSTVKNMPVALLITQFEAQMLIECSAFVSLLILVANLIIKGTIYLLKQRNHKKELREELSYDINTK
ncbi:ABC transporter permease subunit [Eubacterium sp. 1001713B170207_170306_E7]|uniref:ABC transporter permease subunit n=1 Tax=Eubacterium sp. 1001713B170207_170306_E7 TaxID=2787097 RepID=UPI001A9AACA7|nr:ABC transporter permease subunit [Eubacterium sp. 1001713B170207_170306_E7]